MKDWKSSLVVTLTSQNVLAHVLKKVGNEEQHQMKAFGFNLVEKSLFSRCPPSLSLPSYFLSFIQILGLVLRRAPGAGGRVGAQGARSRKSRSACILCDIQIQIQIHQKENSLYACILW